jgi:hypothetical protein
MDKTLLRLIVTRNGTELQTEQKLNTTGDQEAVAVLKALSNIMREL